jgi:cholesterol transport system auxiliary component
MSPHPLSPATPRRPNAGRRSALLCLLGLAPLLPACSSLLGGTPQAPLTSYTLAPVAVPDRAQAAPAHAGLAGLRVLLLEPPQAAAGYDSARMVYQRQPQILEAYTQSAWVDTPARMLAPLLLDTLQTSGALRAVLQAPSPAQAELRLETRVLRLQHSFLQQPSRVQFTLLATLTDQRTRAVLAWQRFDVTQQAASDDAAGGAMAASLAVQTALQQLRVFVQSSVAALAPVQPPLQPPVSNAAPIR